MRCLAVPGAVPCGLEIVDSDRVCCRAWAADSFSGAVRHSTRSAPPRTLAVSRLGPRAFLLLNLVCRVFPVGSLLSSVSCRVWVLGSAGDCALPDE